MPDRAEPLAARLAVVRSRPPVEPLVPPPTRYPAVPASLRRAVRRLTGQGS